MEKVSTIDCSGIFGKFEDLPETALAKFASEFGGALHNIGFVYLTNHGVDTKKVSNVYDVSKSFFNLPAEIKQKYRKQEPRKIYNGYSGAGDEYLAANEKDQVELKELWDVWGEDGYDPEKFPSEVPGFREAFEEVRVDCRNLTLKLLRAFAIYLNLEDKDFFLKNHRGIIDPNVKTQSQMRSLHYFALDGIPPNSIRCGAHSDWGTVTLIFQDMIGGLEVKTPSGQWIPLAPVENAVLINTGQLLELWSGGRLPAAHHRVIILDEERLLRKARQSFIYFVDPDADIQVEPILPIMKGKEYLAKCPPQNAYDFSQKLISAAMSY